MQLINIMVEVQWMQWLPQFLSTYLIHFNIFCKTQILDTVYKAM